MPNVTPLLSSAVEADPGAAAVRVFGSQQLEIERAAAEEHFFQRSFDVGQLNRGRAVAFEVELHRAAHQFLDEGRAHPVGSLDDLTDYGGRDGDALRVQPHEVFASLPGGERETDR